MKILLLAAVLAAPVQDVESLKSEYNDTRAVCRGTLSGANPDEACDKLDMIGAKLKGAGLCWGKAEQEWRDCRVGDE